MTFVAHPMAVACPNCQAPAGQKCTQPSDYGRVKVQWFHLARESAVSA